MDDPQAVGLGDGPRHRLDQPGGLGGGPRGPVGGVGEAAAGQVFQLEEGDPSHVADAIDLDDVGVAELGDRLGLGAEPRGGRRAAGPGRERLERTRAIQGDVAGEVDGPHPAAAEFAEHLVPARPQDFPQVGAEPGRRRSQPRTGPEATTGGRRHSQVRGRRVRVRLFAADVDHGESLRPLEPSGSDLIIRPIRPAPVSRGCTSVASGRRVARRRRVDLGDQVTRRRFRPARPRRSGSATRSGARGSVASRLRRGAAEIRPPSAPDR